MLREKKPSPQRTRGPSLQAPRPSSPEVQAKEVSTQGLRAFFHCSVLGVSQEEIDVLAMSRHQKLLYQHMAVVGNYCSLVCRFNMLTNKYYRSSKTEVE